MDKRPSSLVRQAESGKLEDWRMRGRGIDEQAAAAAAERIGEHAFLVRLDVTAANSVQQAIEMVLARTQSLEIVVNNAGLAGKAAPIWEQTDDDWNRVLAINLTGPFLCVVP
jgi:2-dehydro-3-deoxy-L-rhamnonate dehydrogenase (NAD+)